MFYSREDGWWKVRDEKNNIGMVPSNFLQELEEDLEESESPLNEDTGRLYFSTVNHKPLNPT